MAENLEIEGRMSVRALMQWSDRENGGFSEAPSDALCRPLLKSKKWGPSAINVWKQEGDGDSLLSWMEQLIRHRREMPEIAFGKWSFLPIADPAVLALSYEWGERKSIIIHNLGSDAKDIELQLGARPEKQSIVDRFGDGDMDVRAAGTVALRLTGYGYKWLRVL